MAQESQAAATSAMDVDVAGQDDVDG